MQSNGHTPVVPATWKAEDFADLETYCQPIAVDVYEGRKPPVLVDARGYDVIAMAGDVDNPLIRVALDAFYGSSRKAMATERAPQAEPDIADLAHEARDIQDKILAAIIVAPPYAVVAQCRDGKPPSGHLWYGSFTSEQRRRLADFFYSGADALKGFRQPAGAGERAARDGAGL